MVGTSLGSLRSRIAASSSGVNWHCSGSRGFVRQDIVDVIDLVRAGALTTSHLTTDVRPMQEANAALDDLKAGRTMRTVLVN